MKRTLVGFVLAWTACTNSPSTLVPDASVQTLPWGACAGNANTQCATVQVPLGWNAPTGPQINYFLQRVPAPHGPAHRVLIYLAGGPGASGNAGVTNAAVLQSLVPDMDVVSPDHRGAGQSTWFGCNPDAPSSDLSLACLAQLQAQYGTNVGSYFSATQAARDVRYLVNAFHSQGLEVYLYGESYGTFLLNRYLNLYPDGAEAAVLDSVVRPDGHAAFLPGPIDYPPNHVAHQIFDACAADPFCASKLGNDPWSLLGALEMRLASGFCAGAVPPGTSDPVSWLRETLYLLEGATPGATQTAFVYRLNRCAPGDVAAITYAATHTAPSGDAGTSPALDGGGQECFLLPDGGRTGACGDAAAFDGPPTMHTAPRGANDLLYFNIELSDMFSERPPTADFQAAEALAFVNDEVGFNRFLQAIGEWPWPLYTPGVARQWAPTSIPVLLLDGTLDTQTPDYVLDDARTAFTSAHQQLVIIPNAVHVTLEHSAVTASTEGRTCGLQLIEAFLGNPTGAIDMRCTTEIPPLDFHGTGAVAAQLFGTTDLYE